MDTIESSAKLIEQGAYLYINNTLSRCKEHRNHIFRISLNIGVFFIFVSGISIILYYRYKQKLSPYDAYQKQIKDHDYILSKIRYYQGHMHKLNIQSDNIITGLPPIDAPISKEYPF